MKNGFVQLPLVRYDQLILERKSLMDEYNELEALLDDIVKIEADWEGEPILRIDLSILAARIHEKFEQSEFADKWTMMDMSSRVETIWGAFKRKAADENQA